MTTEQTALADLLDKETRIVIVTNLDKTVDKYDLKEKFETFGHCPSVEFPYHTIETQNFGSCAKVQFALAPAARAACSKLGNRKWRRNKIQAYTLDRWKKVLKQRGFIQGNSHVQEVFVKNKVFVGGLMPQFSVHTIRSYFQQFGSIKKTKLVTDRNGHSKGYGFIEFINESHAQSVLLEKFHWIQGKQINIGPVKEKVAFRQQINQALNLSTKQQDVHISGGKLQESTFIHLQKRKINRSRSYNKSISKSSLRSLDSTANLLVISSEEELKETKEEIEAYQNKVDKQLTKIQEEEQKEKTLTKRRVERRARWARRK